MVGNPIVGINEMIGGCEVDFTTKAIGEYKRSRNVAIIQAGRWEQLLADMVERAAALGVSEAAITAIMTAIHDESVRVQNQVLESQK